MWYLIPITWKENSRKILPICKTHIKLFFVIINQLQGRSEKVAQLEYVKDKEVYNKDEKGN